MLSSLASCEHGFEYLQQKNIFKKFSELLVNVDSHPFSNLLLPGLLKFFGGVCQHKPDQVLSQHPEFLTKLFTQMTLGDTLSLETVAFIARGANGKRILNSEKGKLLYSYSSFLVKYLSDIFNFMLNLSSVISEVI